jgi:hypothetical protein
MKQLDPSLATRYLEILIHDEGEESFHDNLVKCYVDSISAGGKYIEISRSSLNAFIRSESARLELVEVLSYFESDGTLDSLTPLRFHIGEVRYIGKT